MASVAPVQHRTESTRPLWAIALHFDEVVIVKIDGEDDRTDTAKVKIFTLTANGCFWPYLLHEVIQIPCSSLLRYLPDEHQPTPDSCVIDTRHVKQRCYSPPVNLPPAAWKLFVDVREAHHARMKDRSLAARKQERWEERQDSDDSWDYNTVK